VSRFIRDLDETFAAPKKRSLLKFRVCTYISMVLAAVAAGGLAIALGNEILVAVATVAVVLFFGVIVQFLFLRSEARFLNEQERMYNRWLARRVELQELTNRDELTQLQNRRFFYEQMEIELDLATRYKRDLSILMLDVDDLKLINDEFGHQVGDVVLGNLGRVLNKESGENYITARLGGDEFAVILPSADRKQGDRLCKTIWETLSKEPICETDTASIYLGVSIGIGGYPWSGQTLDEIIHWADSKLYANKLDRKGLKKRDATPADDNRLVSAVVDVLSSALEVRDKMTHRHARRVARMSAYVARELKLTEDQVLQIEYAAALHDIGKIGVPDDILRKVEPLDHEEWQQMKRHSDLGFEILKGVDFLREAAEIVHCHHERYDGKGYPRGLKGDEIPLGARVFAVVDAYDAMTSRRPYRLAMPQEDALEEVMRHSNSQFDPEVVSAFLRMARSNPDGFKDEDPDGEAGGVTHADDEPANNGDQASGRDLAPIDLSY
jgi:diguanylate cyclase (GGDEF)-like protein/putative nucleotidyltransferase with HDIG domain